MFSLIKFYSFVKKILQCYVFRMVLFCRIALREKCLFCIFLVLLLPHFDWLRRFTLWQNTDQKISRYRHFFRSGAVLKVFLFYQISCSKLNMLRRTRKFYIRRNKNKVDSIETGRTVIVDLLPWSDLKKCMHGTLF